METTVIIENIHNKSTSEITLALWNEKKYTPEWRGVFRVLYRIKEPPEVVALKARQAAAKKSGQ